MSFSFARPNQRGRQGRGGQSGHWPPPQQSQSMHYGGEYFPRTHQSFVAPRRTTESYLNEMQQGYGFYPAQTQPSWHQPTEYIHPRDPPHQSKRPRVESRDYSSLDRQINRNQNPQNQASSSSNHGGQTQVRGLGQQIKIEEPYVRSSHQIQDVLRVADSENTVSRSSNEDTKADVDGAVNNSSPEFGQHSNQAVVIDLTNDAVVIDLTNDEENGVERSNKENTSSHNIVCEPAHETSKNKTTAANAVNIEASQAVPPLVLRKSNGNTPDWSVHRPIVSNRVSTGAMKSSRTDVNPNIIQNNNLESTNSERVIRSSSTSNGSSSKAQDRHRNDAASRKELQENGMVTALPLDERRGFCQASAAKDTAPSSRNEVPKTIELASTSGQANHHKKIKLGPWSSKPCSYREKNIQATAVSTQQIVSSLESNSEEDKNKHVSSISKDVATNNDSNSKEISLQVDSNSGKSAEVDLISEDLNDERDSGNSTRSDFSENNLDEFNSSDTSISTEVNSSADESDTESERSDSSDELVNPSVPIVSCKRKDQDSDQEVFIPASKKPRPILESDSESDDDVNLLPSTSRNSLTLNEKIKIKSNVPVSKTTLAKLNIAKHHKVSNVKTQRVEDQKSVHIASSSVKKRTPERVYKSLPKSELPSQNLEGKKRHIINNSRKLVVLLKRLSPHEISKFSVPRSVVDKSTVLYQKDVLHQIKYFISFIEQLSTKNSRISLASHVDNSQNLCNQLLFYSNRSECGLVELKYLSSEHSKITFKTLSNPELDIKKMYKSFLDFRKCSSEKLNHFTIFTNLELAIENLKSNRVDVKHENGRYYFSVKEGHELHQKFVKSLTLYTLAELLHQCIDQRKQKNFNTELIKKYHLALVKEKVFKIHNNKNSKGKQIHEAKFHMDFVRNTALSDAAKELRRHLTAIMRSHPQASMGFVLTDPFGKDTNLDPNPEIDIVKVADALGSKDQAKLSILKDELKKIVGHVLEKIQNNIFGFSRDFLEGKDLPGNLKRLRWQLKVWCDHRGIDFNRFCRDYTISIDDFCNDYPVHRLPQEDGKKLFEEFFKIFNFANIQNHIHLNKDIKKINDVDCLNAMQEEILTGLASENLGKETFASMLKVVSKNEIIRASHKQPQPKINIEFHENVISTFEKKLPTHGIVLCLTRSVSLTNVIVKQLSAKLNYKEDKECLFISNKVLLEKTSDVLNALADKSTHLLVVQWNKLMEKETVLDVFSKLLNVIDNDDQSMKSIIVIVHQKDYSSDLNVIFSDKITDKEHSFELSEDSRVRILQDENISLQNRGLSLMTSNLIVDEHVLILLKSTEILNKLLTGKLVIGKNLVKPEGYKESLFKIQIKQCIIIDPKIFHKQIDDVFIVRNIVLKDFKDFLPSRQKILAPNDVPASMRINGRYILLGFTVSRSFFDDYVEKNSDRNVHLLRFESGSFIWEKTFGNNEHVLQSRLEFTDDFLNKQETEDVVSEGPKTIIICGESGLGKSVCFYNLARDTKNLYKIESIDAHWSVQVNLDKARLAKYVKKNINMALEKDFVADFLCNYLDLDAVQSKIMTMIFKNQLKIKLSLFFDNYEQLPSSHRDFVIQLLQELQASFCEKIYVTSSLNTRFELEKALAVFSYTLEFSEMKKVDLLQKFWSKSFGENDFSNEAGYFISHYSETESEKDDLTAKPLHLKMLAEMHNPNDEDYTCIETEDQLYKLYIKHKGIEDMESAFLYSLHKLLDKDQVKMIKIDEKLPRKDFSLPDDLRHRTFLEHLAAKWLGKHNHSLTNSKFISLLDSVSPLFLKSYLAEFKSDDKVRVVCDFAANGHLNLLGKMLPHCIDKLELTTIIRSKNLNSRQNVRFLLDHYNDTKEDIMQHGEFRKKRYAEANVVMYVNRREKSKKKTPLEVAAQMKNVPIACELLLKGANTDGIDKEFITDVARYIADELCKSDSEWLRPIAEKLLKLRPNAVAHLERTKKYPRMLSYFFVHGRVELISKLLKNDPRERCDLLLAKVDNKTPLDLVNESHVLSDDERLEITKYIVSNVGEDLERKNKYYLADVLKAAAECEQERTFEYFIGKYPDKHMGFLESAMKSNRLDVIDFLRRKTDRMMYPDGNTALHKAVSLGVSLKTIKFLVKNIGGIDNKNKFGETPLCIAFKEGQELEIISYLVKRNADLFARDELGLYPWCHAILEESKYTPNDQIFIMMYLQDTVELKAPETFQKISFDSDQKRQEVAKKLPFFQKLISTKLEMHIALKANNENLIKFLIRHGTDVNHQSDDGQMPLHTAINMKRYELAYMLLDYGAVFNVENRSNKTPLQLLKSNGDDSKESKELRLLLETAKKLFAGDEKFSSQVSRHLINCRDKKGQTLLHIAAKNGHLNAIKDMIKQSKDHCINDKNFPSIDINAKDVKGRTPLYLVKQDNVAKELLVNGAIFEPAITPLLLLAKQLIQAVKDKDVDQVKKLIVKNECLVNAKDESGKSCLHYAAIFECTEIVKILLAVKVSDVDAIDSNMETPLHYAVKEDNIECMVLLLKAGASYDIKNKEGNRPFDLADKTNESLQLMEKIHAMFFDIKSDQPRILNNENPDALVEYLTEIEKMWHVSKDVVVNIVDRKKNTLLHIATKYDFIVVVENLLRQGAMYNPKNREGKTPEPMAISTKQLFRNASHIFHNHSVSSWVNFDPELVINLRNNNGYTLLHECANKKEEVSWLIENGADKKATSNRGSKIKVDKKRYPEIYELLFQD